VRGIPCLCSAEPPRSPDDSRLSGVGTAYFARALEKNTTLQSFEFRGEFVPSFLAYFARALEKNTTLQSFELRGEFVPCLFGVGGSIVFYVL